MKNKILIIVLAGFLIVALSLLYTNFMDNKINYTSSYDGIKKKIDEQSSTCSFDDYFKIVKAEYMINPNENTIKYSVVFKNITGKNMSFNYQVYKEKELIAKYISSIEPSIPANKTLVELPNEKRAIINMDSGFLYPYQSFSELDQTNIDNLASKIYIEFYCDGKFDYFEMNVKKVNKFSEY